VANEAGEQEHHEQNHVVPRCHARGGGDAPGLGKPGPGAVGRSPHHQGRAGHGKEGLRPSHRAVHPALQPQQGHVGVQSQPRVGLHVHERRLLGPQVVRAGVKKRRSAAKRRGCHPD